MIKLSNLLTEDEDYQAERPGGFYSEEEFADQIEKRADDAETGQLLFPQIGDPEIDSQIQNLMDKDKARVNASSAGTAGLT